MKPDDFENQLQLQPWRRLPAEWREDILLAARRASAPRPDAVATPALPWWRELFWPSPVAWAGAAACWALIFALNRESAAAGAGDQHAKSPPAAVVRLALAERRHLLSSLADSPAAPPNPSPVPLRPRPRSERSLAQLYA